jgi:hypothetical protein
MFMRIEAAPLVFLITILAVVMLVQQVGAGHDGAATGQADSSAQPAIQLAGISPSGFSAKGAFAAKRTADTQVALLRAPIALVRPDLPQR